MDKKVIEAVSIIENAGGFVMFPESSEEEREIRKQVHAIEQQQAEELQRLENESLNDFEERKKEAFKEATHALYHKKDLSFQDIDDIFYENGIEPDYIEDWIESQI